MALTRNGNPVEQEIYLSREEAILISEALNHQLSVNQVLFLYSAMFRSLPDDLDELRSFIELSQRDEDQEEARQYARAIQHTVPELSGEPASAVVQQAITLCAQFKMAALNNVAFKPQVVDFAVPAPRPHVEDQLVAPRISISLAALDQERQTEFFAAYHAAVTAVSNRQNGLDAATPWSDANIVQGLAATDPQKELQKAVKKVADIEKAIAEGVPAEMVLEQLTHARNELAGLETAIVEQGNEMSRGFRR